MTHRNGQSRRGFLARATVGASTLLLSGCYDLSQKPWVLNLLGEVERLTRRAQRLFAGSHALAPEFEKADIAPSFRANGTLRPDTEEYDTHAANGFRDWRVTVGGLVERPLSLSLDDLRRFPSRTQITRHDCVEGWSCIGEWKGVQLSRVLGVAGVKPAARYVMFYCADPMGDGDDTEYYESLDLLEATHPQTLLAYELNGSPLPIPNGAPVRLRAERQLGYKMAKYITRIDLVDGFRGLRGGKGGYWEDQGYAWYAGI
jgi:DMSO/TMAO reductase YedYZ molybdopterin-dependent catalytic subunit